MDSSASKSIFTSVTFWSLILGVLGTAAQRYGLTLPEDTAGLANDLAALAGAVGVVYGRFQAKQPVHFLPPPPDTSVMGDSR